MCRCTSIGSTGLPSRRVARCPVDEQHRVAVAVELRPLPELARVLERELVQAEQLARRSRSASAGRGEVEPEELVARRAAPRCGRVDLGQDLHRRPTLPGRGAAVGAARSATRRRERARPPARSAPDRRARAPRAQPRHDRADRHVERRGGLLVGEARARRRPRPSRGTATRARAPRRAPRGPRRRGRAAGPARGSADSSISWSPASTWRRAALRRSSMKRLRSIVIRYASSEPPRRRRGRRRSVR